MSIKEERAIELFKTGGYSYNYSQLVRNVVQILESMYFEKEIITKYQGEPNL